MSREKGSVTILVVNSGSPSGESSTRRVVAALVERLQRAFPEANIVERDLVQDPLPHFNPLDPSAAPTSDRVCAEFLGADMIVIGTPMWNFSIPSVLKAWIDHLVRAGVTFRYTDEGPRGLASPGKSLYLVEASGGIYAASPASVLNHVTPYLEQVFRFLGVTKIESILIEGTAVQKESAESTALAKIRQLLPAERGEER